MKSMLKLSTLCVASVLAAGTVSAERMIVTYEGNGNAMKQGHEVLVQGNGWFAVDLDDKGMSAMRNMPGFKSIEKDQKRFPLAIYNDDAGDPNAQQITPYAIYQSQANLVTLQPTTKKVCVIDSGIAREQGETGGHNPDFIWSSITGDSDPGTGDWFRDGGFHGTHVAGTVAAADNNIGVVGMAPGNPLHIIKVFNDAGWGYSSNLAQAADLCAAAGAEIITMSLGGGAANSTEENAFNNFTANGGLVLAAAGNAGDNSRLYPAGYASIMMVGANDADNNIASFSQFPSCTNKGQTNDGFCVEVTAGGVATLSTYPGGTATLSNVTADGAPYASSAMENNGSASGATYFMGTAEATDAGANGKICMIDRGVISFHDKVLNCENSGGIGAVIINNVDGMLYGTLGDPNNTSIPAVGADLADRTGLLAASNATVSVVAGDYGYSDGTSMATPGAAGVAALVWSNNPGCTGTEVRDALKATAEDQGAAGKDVYFGYGIVKAADANAYLSGQACGGQGGNVPPTASFTFNCTDLACTFNGTASSDPDGSIASYSWDFGDGNGSTAASPSHSFAASGDYSVSLTVTDNEGATGGTSQTVSVSDGSQPPPAAEIVLTGTRASNGGTITLNWTGATTANVDVYVFGNYNNTTANDGTITYRVNRNTTYTFTVCEEGSTTACSNNITL